MKTAIGRLLRYELEIKKHMSVNGSAGLTVHDYESNGMIAYMRFVSIVQRGLA